MNKTKNKTKCSTADIAAFIRRMYEHFRFNVHPDDARLWRDIATQIEIRARAMSENGKKHGKPKIYKTAVERQQAYRKRLAGKLDQDQKDV